MDHTDAVMAADLGRGTSQRLAVLLAALGAGATLLVTLVVRVSELAGFVTVLAVGGCVFGLNAVIACLFGARRSWTWAVVFGVVGASFWFWGFMMGVFLLWAGGTVGLPQALLTACLLRLALGSWRVGFLVVAALVPAWLLGWGIESLVRLGEAQSSASLGDPFDTLDGAVLAWNAFAGATLLIWAIRTGPPRPRVRPGHCQRCGYNLVGLDGRACPECGLQNSGFMKPRAGRAVQQARVAEGVA